MEREKSEVSTKCINILKKVEKGVGNTIFIPNLFSILVSSSYDREETLKFLASCLPNSSKSKETSKIYSTGSSCIVRGLCLSLQDSDPLTVRAALDLLVNKFPMDSITFSTSDIAVIAKYSSETILKKDMSLNRRLYSWWLGHSEDRSQQQLYLRENSLNHLKLAFEKWFDLISGENSEYYDHENLFRVLIALLDKPDISHSLLLTIFPKIIMYIGFKNSKTSIKSSIRQVKSEYFIRKLLNGINPYFVWTQLIMVLFRNLPLEEDIHMDNLSKTLSNMRIDIYLFTEFVDLYLSDNSDIASEYISSTFLALISVSCYVSDLLNCDDSRKIVEDILKVSISMYMRLPLKNMVSSSIPIDFREVEGSKLLELIKGIYYVDEIIKIWKKGSSQSNGFVDLSQDFVDLIWSFNHKKEFDSPTSFIFRSIFQLKMLILSPNLTPNAFEYSCNLLVNLIRFSVEAKTSYRKSQNFVSSISSKSQENRAIDFGAYYLNKLFKISIFPNNYADFRISTETIVNLIFLGEISNKSVLLDTPLLLKGLNIPEAEAVLCDSTILSSIISNLWKFLSYETRLETIDLINKFTEIYGESIINNIILEQLKPRGHLSESFFEKFCVFWVTLYCETTKFDEAREPNLGYEKSKRFYVSVNSTVSNFGYYGLLLTTLDNFTCGTTLLKNPRFSGHSPVPIMLDSNIKTGLIFPMSYSESNLSNLDLALIPIIHSIYLYIYQNVGYIGLGSNYINDSGILCQDYFYIKSLELGVDNIVFYFDIINSLLGAYKEASLDLFLTEVNYINWFPYLNYSNSEIHKLGNTKSNLSEDNKNGDSKPSPILIKPALAFLSFFNGQSSNFNKPISFLEILIYLIIPLLQIREQSNSILSDINGISPSISAVMKNNSRKHVRFVNRASDVRSASLSLLERVIFIEDHCTHIKVSKNSFSNLIRGLFNVLSFDLPKSTPSDDMNTSCSVELLKNQIEVISILSKILERIITPCACNSCQLSDTNPIELKTLEILFLELIQSNFYSRVMLFFLLKLNQLSDDTEPLRFSALNSWVEFILLSLKIFSRNITSYNNTKTDNKETPKGIMGNLVLPLINIMTETLNVLNSFVLNVSLGYTVDFNFESPEIITKNILDFLDLSQEIISVCISFPSLLPPPTVLHDDYQLSMIKKYFIKIFSGLKKLDETSPPLDQNTLVNEIIHRISCPYSFSLSYCLSTFISLFNSIVRFDTPIKKTQDEVFLYLSSRTGKNRLSKPPNFIPSIVVHGLKMKFQKIWLSNPSEFSLAICDFFENYTGCWLEHIFEPSNSINLSLKCETKRGHFSNSKSGDITGFSRKDSNSFVGGVFGSSYQHPFTNNEVNQGSNNCFTLNSSELSDYYEFLNNRTDYCGILFSLEFLNSLEFLHLTPDEKSTKNSIQYNLFNSLILFLTKLIDLITHRINYANKRSSDHELNNSYSSYSSVPGYSMFSSLSDIGLLRTIELVIETRLLEFLNSNSKSYFYSPGFDREASNHSDYYSIDKKDFLATDFDSLFTSSLKFLKIVQNNDIYDKPWLPFVFRASISISKFLQIVNLEKFPDLKESTHINTSDLKTNPDSIPDQIEQNLNRIIEKVITSTGKSISGSQWLRRVGKISQFNKLRSVESPISRKNLGHNMDSIPIEKNSNSVLENDEFLKKSQLNFKNIENCCRTGLNPHDSAVLYALRSHGYVEPLYYWCNDDVIEINLQTLSLNVFPNLESLFISNSFSSQLINTFVVYVLSPLNKILSIDRHVSYSSQDIFRKLGIQINSNLLNETISPLLSSGDSTIDMSLLSPMTTSLENSIAFKNIKSKNAEIKTFVYNSETEIHANHILCTSNFDWRCVDQASRIHVLVLDSLVSLCSLSRYEKPLGRSLWELFSDSNFFSQKRMSFSIFPVFPESQSAGFNKEPFKYGSEIYSYLPHNYTLALLSSSFARWEILTQYCSTNDRNQFNDILLRLGNFSKTTLFTNKSQEALQKSLLLRRVSMMIWSGQPEQYISNFPTIQERLVELIKNHTHKNIISEIFLCLRVVLLRMGPNRLISMWPVIITELSRIIGQFMKLDQNSLTKTDLSTVNMLYSCCKFLDLLLVLKYPDFSIHNSTFIREDCSSFGISKLGFYSEINTSAPTLLGEAYSGENGPINDHKSQVLSSPVSRSFRGSENSYTGLLDLLGAHLKSLSVLANISSDFSISQKDTLGSPLSNDLQKRHKKSKNLTIVVPNNTFDIPSHGVRTNGENNAFSTPGKYSNDINSKKSLSPWSCQNIPGPTNDPFKINFRRPLLTESYISSPLDLIPFLNSISDINYLWNIENYAPDVSFIESIVSQDLMTFYDLSLSNTPSSNLRLSPFNRSTDPSGRPSVFSIFENITADHVTF
ncbi:Protein dopey-1 [Smittium mucronatum]|uniref:Protein dopey-1 n=1 Tax=Smittium mucronatum TaxID=133383 RepID=A0A1R0H145_9FUNG|nr:Protein dopey-1 [Smittium mucronatum]